MCLSDDECGASRFLDSKMLPRLASSVSRTLVKPTSVRPAIQKRFFGDPHADNGSEAVGTHRVEICASSLALRVRLCLSGTLSVFILD